MSKTLSFLFVCVAIILSSISTFNPQGNQYINQNWATDKLLTDDGYLPKITTDFSGFAHAVWIDGDGTLWYSNNIMGFWGKPAVLAAGSDNNALIIANYAIYAEKYHEVIHFVWDIYDQSGTEGGIYYKYWKPVIGLSDVGIIDSGYRLSGASLTQDNLGNLHLAYISGWNSSIAHVRYSTRSPGGNWTIPEQVTPDSEENWNFHTSIVALANNIPMIAWWGNPSQKYSIRSPMGWPQSVEFVGSADNRISNLPNLVINSNGDVFALGDNHDGLGFYLCRLSNMVDWSCEIIPGSETSYYDSLGQPALAIDSTDQQYVVWNGVHWVFRNADGNWSQVDVASTKLGKHPTIAVDTHGFSHMVYEYEGGIYYTTNRPATGYSISGLMLADDRVPISDVEISIFGELLGVSDNTGFFNIPIDDRGVWQLTFKKPGYSFSPNPAKVIVPSTKIYEFYGVNNGNPPSPFIDLPIAYDGQETSFRKILSPIINGGRISSWFDHAYPNLYRPPDRNGLLLYNNTISSYNYDEHNGYDFSQYSNDPIYKPDLIVAAADGVVAETLSECPNIPDQCPNSWGNYVLIYHELPDGNDYFTRYAHLESLEDNIWKGAIVKRGETIGLMGNSGRSDGKHLHFGLYLDNGDQVWSGSEVDRVVDPFGWSPYSIVPVTVPDPWMVEAGFISTYFWLYDVRSSFPVDWTVPTSIMDPTNQLQVYVPAYTFTGPATIGISQEPVPAPKVIMRSSGLTSRVELLQYFPAYSDEATNDYWFGAESIDNYLSSPLTISVTYSLTDTLHLDQSTLQMMYWEDEQQIWQHLPSIIDVDQRIITTTTTKFGFFDLQAQLLCPEDQSEPNDSFENASDLDLSAVPSIYVIDSQSDQDWFEFQLDAGDDISISVIESMPSLTLGLKFLDFTSSTLVDLGDNDSFEFQAPASGKYYIVVHEMSGFLPDCSSTYQINTDVERHNYLPLLLN